MRPALPAVVFGCWFPNMFLVFGNKPEQITGNRVYRCRLFQWQADQYGLSRRGPAFLQVGAVSSQSLLNKEF
jgi:hypothetical protein